MKKMNMLSLRRQIQHWHFSILIIVMYWNLQGISLQISSDTDRISKEGRKSGQIKFEEGMVILTGKKMIRKGVKRGEASAVKCYQLKVTKKERTEALVNKNKTVAVVISFKPGRERGGNKLMNQ